MRNFHVPAIVTDAGDTKVNKTFSALKKQTSVEAQIGESLKEDSFSSTQKLLP